MGASKLGLLPGGVYPRAGDGETFAQPLLTRFYELFDPSMDSLTKY